MWNKQHPNRKIYFTTKETISIFPLWTFHLYVAATAYGVYISQLIRYSRACGSNHDFLGRGLILTMKLLNQGFLLINKKSSLRKFCGRHDLVKRRVWRYQRGNQNPYIEEEQTTQWPKEKVQKNKQRSTKHTHKTKDRVTRTLLKTGGELGCSGTVSSSRSTSGTHRVNLVTNHCYGISSSQITTDMFYLF